MATKNTHTKSKWAGKPCPLCGQGTLLDGEKSQQMAYHGHPYEYTVHGAFCDHCQDGFPLQDDVEESAWIAFRDKVDAEERADLARIRKKLKLTQQAAAMLTGGGKNAFSRYERGEAKPMPAVVNLFRLLDRHPELLNELNA